MSGTAALITAIVSVRVTRNRLTQECDQRIHELRTTFIEGMAMADRRPIQKPSDMEERWSGLD